MAFTNSFMNHNLNRINRTILVLFFVVLKSIKAFRFLQTIFGDSVERTLWQGLEMQEFPTVEEDIETEVLVIGGGICGVLCAYQLSKKHKVILVEKNRIASARTAKTTAVITALQDIYYMDLIKKFGKTNAKLYLDACLEAIEEYQILAKDYDFDFERVSSYKYFKDNEELLKLELKAIQSLGFEASIEDEYALAFPNQAQMNPLKLISQLLNSVTVYENTEIFKIKKQIAYTKHNVITAKHIVVATGYPFLKFKGLYPIKLTQKKSYVAVVENVSKTKDFNAIGSRPGDFYFRTYKNNLIIGGNDQKTGMYNGGGIPIVNYILKYYPNHRISYQWVNQDCVSIDGIPYIGSYFKNKNIYVATGFNLWGMTGAMIASKVLTDKIERNKNKYEKLFCPQRKSPLFPVLKNISVATINLLKPKKRCTHLGCALFYNKEEQVYECPCHGTKYNMDGTIVFNPANQDKPLK